MMMNLHPIMQLERYERDNEFTERQLHVKLSSQSYYTPKKKEKGGLNYNKTIFEFNKDYLENIRIFVPRIILSNLIETLIHGKISILDTLLKSEQDNVIDKKLDMIINGVLEETDTTVSDCFFSFSNEDYIEMIQQTELEKYSATYTGGDGSPATKYSKDALLNALDSINSMATMNETITEITKTVYDIASIPSEDSSVKASDGSVAMANSNWLNRIVSAIMKPIVKSLLTPQVMLLFVIFVWRGIVISIKAQDNFGTLIGIGLTVMIGLQALVNVAVVTNTIPVTGMPLPFFSYGGSAMLANLIAVGILLSVSRNSKQKLTSK